MKKTDGNSIDLFLNEEFDVIIHGCNCFEAMGAGIAAEIASRIPEAKMMDNVYSNKGDVKKLSNWSFAYVRRQNNVGTVINLYTQYYPGADLIQEALYLGFMKLSRTLDHTIKIGIPLIGCGIAGGNWDEIGSKIEKIMKNHNITVVHFNRQNNEKTN